MQAWALAHRDVKLSVLPKEFNDHSVAPEIRSVEIREVDVRIASVILAAAVLAQYTCRRGLVRDQAAREIAPLDKNGLVEVVIEPSLEIVACHSGHSIIGQSPLVRPQNEVAARVGGCDGQARSGIV